MTKGTHWGVIDETGLSFYSPVGIDSDPTDSLAKAFYLAWQMIDDGAERVAIVRCRYSKRHELFVETMEGCIEIDTRNVEDRAAFGITADIEDEDENDNNHTNTNRSYRNMTTAETSTETTIEPRYISALINLALQDRINRGPDQTSLGVTDNAFESDGRKAKRAARALIDAGLLSLHPQGATYTLHIDRVLARVTATRPMLSSMINDWQRSTLVEERAPIGIQFDQLSPEERLWVVSYPHEYRWLWIANSREIVWKLGDALPEGHWRMTLIVSDAALRDEFERAIRARKIEALMKQNAKWALEKMLKLDETTVKAFMAIGSGGYFPSGNDERFSGDYATWAETAEQMMAQANARLTEAMRRVEAAAKIAQAVAKHGGWDKLGADLRVKVEARVDGSGDANDDE